MRAIDIKSDFHMHTSFTDGKCSVSEMILAANKKGMKKIAITEHIRADSSWVNEYIEAVKRARDGNGNCMPVILGFETKLLDMDGTLDISGDALNSAELLICSLHRIPGVHDMGSDNAVKKSETDIKSMDPHKILQAYIEALKAICGNKSVDIIGHPFDLLARFNVPMPDEAEMHGIAKCIAAGGKIVEINSKYGVPSAEFIRICMQHGVKFSIGSDAHDSSRVGDTSKAVELLISAGGSINDIAKMCLV